MATLQAESSNRIGARRAALEEASSVLRAVSSGSFHSGEGGVIDPGIARGGAATDEAAVAVAPGSTAVHPVARGGDDGPRSSPKLSRSDAVAAAKRRAEERRRANNASSSSSFRRVDRKPPAAVTASYIPPGHKESSPDDNPSGSMDWFNLLGVVTNPSSGGGNYYDGHYYNPAFSPGSSHHHHQYSHHWSRHGGLSNHGTPISLDHVGSDGTRAGLGRGNVREVVGDGSVAAALLTAAGLTDWASYANASSAATNATLTSVASSLDEFTGWFDHYSRKYLGTVAGIDAGGSILGDDDIDGNNGGGGLMAGGILGATGVGAGVALRPSMVLEYDPEFGPDDMPQSQLEELPPELVGLDLGSVESFLRDSGMLGMRFEDRGGGFHVVRERIGGRGGRCYGSNKKKDEGEATAGDSITDDDNNDVTTTTAAAAAATIEFVPEIFFSPYFDLTDPINFERLLLISDEEVAHIREREVQLHALADRKVREAEEAASRDAEVESMPPRRSPRKGEELSECTVGAAADRAAGESTLTRPKSRTSLTREARTLSTPADDNVITLRKPETFTSHLDAIELVLLGQVRSKSERFFRETNRFSELQGLVTESVDEVRELRAELQSIRERCVTNVEVVPVMDDCRRDLRGIGRVLEAVEDVVNCKASVASLMAAGDYLGAVEALHLARSFLAERPPEEDEAGVEGAERNSTGEAVTRHRSHCQQHNQFSLGKLRALSKVGDQLNEYEKLVVQNLTNELVETFLVWGADGNVDHRAPPRVSLSTGRRAQVRNVVRSLRACGRLSVAGAAYQAKLCELVSVTVKAIVTECVTDAARDHTSAVPDGGDPNKGTMAGVASMSLDQFFDCINMLFDQVLGLLWGAFAVNLFCIDEGFILDDYAPNDITSLSSSSSSNNNVENEGVVFQQQQQQQQHTPSATAAALAAAADLSEKSVSELLRLRREAHSLVSFDGMRRLWDTSLAFAHRLEKFSGRKAYGLRGTLLAQAKAFVERRHESNVTALVAALDGERWVQCNVSAERQASLTRLCSGRAAFLSRKAASAMEVIASPVHSTMSSGGRDKLADAEVEGVRYKVVWSCLLLLEMVIDDVTCAAHFQTLAANVVSKVTELLRLFNSRSTHLVLSAGAIHSAARLKSINAKHLAIVTQCIALVLAVLPHVRAALMAQLPPKQHTLLYDLEGIKGEYKEHGEKILGKLVSIIGGIVEHSLAPRIAAADFDARARIRQVSMLDEGSNAAVNCCLFLDSVVTNTKKMHQVLAVMLPAELLRDVFSRIFAYLDHKVPSLFKAAAAAPVLDEKFMMPSTDSGKLQMIREVEYMARTLNGLPGVEPWNFRAAKILEQELDLARDTGSIVKRGQTELPVPEVEEHVKAEEEDTETEKNTEIEDDHSTERAVLTMMEGDLQLEGGSQAHLTTEVGSGPAEEALPGMSENKYEVPDNLAPIEQGKVNRCDQDQ